MRSRRRRARSFLVLTLCGALSFCASGSGAVDWNLCLGDDGHTTIELSHADSECWSDARRHHGRRAPLDIHELEHHGCRDIPLVEGNPGHGPPRGLTAAVAAISWRLDRQRPQRQLGKADCDRASNTEIALRCVRSIVLII